MNDKITPALFVSHGSPMNAIMQNKYTEDLHKIGESLRGVDAILVISAHWETFGLEVTASERPSTYHDFRGFPQELFNVEYPVRGAVELIPELEKLVKEPLKLNKHRGLDHGAWSMLAHLFSDASIPVLQLSIDRNKSFEQHLELAKKLAPLRKKNVLILASGNVTHNLYKAILDDMNAAPQGQAVQFDELIRNAFLNNDAEALVNIKTSSLYRENHPTDDHFIPLLYLMGVRNENDKVSFPHMSWQAGNLSMRHILLN